MKGFNCDPLALTTAINSLAVAVAVQLNDKELGMAAAIFNQLGDTLETIEAQRDFALLIKRMLWNSPPLSVDSGGLFSEKF